MNEKPLSIKDISAMAGVSIATVSRIINKSGHYSPKTEKRVLEIINATSYTPNMVARGLRINKMNNIGILAPDITNEFFAKLVSGIQTELFKQNFHSFICNTNEDPVMERKHFETLQTQNVAGLIYIGGVGFPSGTTRAVTIPTVFIDRIPGYVPVNDNFVIVESDNVQGGKLATSRLIDHGCRHIILLTDARRLSSQQDRINGYIEAHGAAGIPINTNFIIDLKQICFESAYHKISELLNAGVQFDGVFATTDWLAMGAYVAITEHGLSIPGDIKLIGYDDIPIARHNAKPLTTIRQDVDAMVDTTVSSLFNISSEEKKPVQSKIKIPVSLIVRQTA